MKALILTLFWPRRGFQLFDEEFEDDLTRKSALIFGLYPFTKFLPEYLNGKAQMGFLFHFLELVLATVLSILLGMFCAYLLHRIGKKLGGQASYAEVFSALAFSLIWLLIGSVLRGFMQESDVLGHEYNTDFMRNFILVLSLILFFSTLIQGLMTFHRFGFKKAILNVSPLLILEIGILGLRFFLF